MKTLLCSVLVVFCLAGCSSAPNSATLATASEEITTQFRDVKNQYGVPSIGAARLTDGTTGLGLEPSPSPSLPSPVDDNFPFIVEQDFGLERSPYFSSPSPAPPPSPVDDSFPLMAEQDFGDEYVVTHLDYYVRRLPNSRTAKLDIYFSLDGSSWSEPYAVRPAWTGWANLRLPYPSTARYMRVEFRERENFFELTEIFSYGRSPIDGIPGSSPGTVP